MTIQTSTNVIATSSTEATEMTIQTSTNVVPATTVPAGSNGTVTFAPSGSQVPVRPSTTTSTMSTAGASSNKAVGVMAAVGAVAAYFV